MKLAGEKIMGKMVKFYPKDLPENYFKAWGNSPPEVGFWTGRVEKIVAGPLKQEGKRYKHAWAKVKCLEDKHMLEFFTKEVASWEVL